MTDISKNKNIMFGTGRDSDTFRPEVIFYKKEDDTYLKVCVPYSFGSIVEKNKSVSTLSLQDGTQIDVLMAFDDLRRMCRDINSWNQILDLLPYTGDALMPALNKLEDENLSSVFARAVSGKRIDKQPITMYFYAASDVDNLVDGSAYYEEWDIRSSDLYRVDKVDESADVACIETNNDFHYLRVPKQVIEQFYTHAKRTDAAVLDLREITNPEGKFQKDPGLLKRIPKLYDRVSKLDS